MIDFRATALFAVSLVLLSSTTTSAALPGSKPNVILIMTDDQGYGDLACHGNPIIQTPNLDKLHSESVRFTDFHVSPTCAPTRSAIMTGRHEFKNGITHTINERERMTLSATTLPQVLESVGYTTGIFGKWHLGDEDAYQPGQRGFDEVFIHGAGGIGQTYPGSCGDAPGNKYFDPVIRHNGRFEKTSGYCTDVFFRQAGQWIDKVKGSQPFFCYITPNAPHGPLDCPPEYEQRYTGKVPENVAKFYGMITNIDDNVGRLMQQLKDSRLERNTLVIFMTDNGSATGSKVFNAGMRAAKGTPYNGGTRVPGFWRWPGTLSPADVPALTCHWDILPTLMELTGAKPDAKLQAQIEGRSLVPLLENPQAPWADRFFFTHVGRWDVKIDPRKTPDITKFAKCSVRWKSYTLVSNVNQGPAKWELYDLTTDPGEATDLSSQKPEVVANMTRAYDEWWTSVLPHLENEGVPFATANPFHTAYWAQYQGPGPNNVPPK
ncbi:MAG TPA: arylsulfatase [Planctomycetaceae bacterium]|nr:arylsulfatase [Planctomycetaceae bacterium]